MVAERVSQIETDTEIEVVGCVAYSRLGWLWSQRVMSYSELEHIIGYVVLMNADVELRGERRGIRSSKIAKPMMMGTMLQVVS